MARRTARAAAKETSMRIKNTTLCLTALALLASIAGGAQAEVRVHYKCESTVKGKCPPPPVPPQPPAPPRAPAPPPPLASHDGFAPPAPPAPPELPSLPAPPAPPEPPPLPEVPAAAHAACTGKAPGTRITHVLRKGETMTGVCLREDGKSVFDLREYRIED